MIVFEENDIVFVRGIGYGTLVSCGLKKRIVWGKAEPGTESLEEHNEHLEFMMIMMGGLKAETEEQAEPPVEEPPLDPGVVNLVKVKLRKSNVMVETPEDTLLKTIDLEVKTFFGRRTSVRVSVPINETITKIVNSVIAKANAETPCELYNVRLVYPHGYLQELGLSKTVRDEEVPHQARLVLLASQTFSLGAGLHSEGLVLSNNNLTATIGDLSESPETVLGTIVLASGSQYWEVKIDRFSEEEGVFLGVAEPGLDLKQHPFASQYWGYIPMCAKKFGPGGTGPQDIAADYGMVCYAGDKVGVLLEFRRGEATLSFFRNGMYLGEAFSGLRGPLSPAFSMFIGNKQITVDPRALIPQHGMMAHR
jgi:hypothetical protein